MNIEMHITQVIQRDDRRVAHRIMVYHFSCPCVAAGYSERVMLLYDGLHYDASEWNAGELEAGAVLCSHLPALRHTSPLATARLALIPVHLNTHGHMLRVCTPAVAVAAFEGAPEELDVTIIEPASSQAAEQLRGASKLVRGSVRVWVWV
jgi:hypothetical protein